MASQNNVSSPWSNRSFPSLTRLIPLVTHFRRGDKLFENGELQTLALVKQGWACRSRFAEDGRRQILGLVLPGDKCGQIAGVATWVDFSVVALSSMVVESCLSGAAKPASILEYALADAAISARWIARLGQRSAVQKVADLIDELITRQGLDEDDHVANAPFLLTQCDLADATGLTAIHVNRTLRDLRQANVLKMRRGEVEIQSMSKLRALAAGRSA